MTRATWTSPLAWFLAMAVVTSTPGKHANDEGRSSPNVPPTAAPEETVWIPPDMRFEPPWREKGDCGPLALYIIMRLQGEQVTVSEVKRLTPLASKRGSSLEDLRQAAEKLDMPAEVRFVNPRDVSSLPRPFILHGVTSIEEDQGHFTVIVDYDAKEGNYALINTETETLGWNPEESVLDGYSGYVLVPSYPASQKWDRFAGYVLLFLGAVALLLCGGRFIVAPRLGRTSR